MKIIMTKPLSAVTALAAVAAVLVAALAALSCSPAVDITKRDWKAMSAGEDTSILSITANSKYIPAIAAKVGLNTNLLVEDRDILEVTFPKEADVLKKKNADIAAAMQKFLKFHTYTKVLDNDKGVADILGGEIRYTFVSRHREKITIKLENVPVTSDVVSRLIASEYTYENGRKLGGAGDTKYGIDYYDVYKTLPVAGAVLGVSGNFFDPYQKNWTLSISFSGSRDSLTGVVLTTVADLSSSVHDDSWRADILNQLVGKFKLRQFKDGKWSDAPGASFTYVPGSLAGTSRIQVAFSPEELIPYVVEISGGLENLQTTNKYWGVNQRVRVEGGGSGPAFNLKKITTGPYQWIDDARIGRTLATGGTPVVAGGELVTTDKEDKNLIVKLYFEPINAPGTSTDTWLRVMDIKDFKKNFKIGYQIEGDSDDISGISNLETGKIVFLDITKIEYGTNTVGQRDRITLTLNTGYTQDTFWGDLHVFIANGFKYDNDNIIFGNYRNWQYTIDGVRYFDYYGPISGSGGPSGGNPNNGSTIQPGSPVAGSLSAGDTKEYSVQLPAGQYKLLVADTGSGQADVLVRVKEDGGNWLGEWSDEGEIEFTVSASGKYIIQVKGYDDDEEGGFGLTVERSEGGSSEESEEVELEFDEETEGTLTAGAVHLYTISLSAGDYIVVWEDSDDDGEYTADIRVSIQKKGSNTWITKDNDEGLYELFIEEEGDYIIQVKGYEAGESGTYALQVSDAGN